MRIILIQNMALLPLHTYCKYCMNSVIVHIPFLLVYIIVNISFISSFYLFYFQKFACCNIDNPTTACNCGKMEYSSPQPSSDDLQHTAMNFQ